MEKTTVFISQRAPEHFHGMLRFYWRAQSFHNHNLNIYLNCWSFFFSTRFKWLFSLFKWTWILYRIIHIMAFIVETSITTEGIVPELQIVQSDWILGTLVHGGLGLTDELRNASFKYPYDYILDHIFWPKTWQNWSRVLFGEFLMNKIFLTPPWK